MNMYCVLSIFCLFCFVLLFTSFFLCPCPFNLEVLCVLSSWPWAPLVAGGGGRFFSLFFNFSFWFDNFFCFCFLSSSRVFFLFFYFLSCVFLFIFFSIFFYFLVSFSFHSFRFYFLSVAIEYNLSSRLLIEFSRAFQSIFFITFYYLLLSLSSSLYR